MSFWGREHEIKLLKNTTDLQMSKKGKSSLIIIYGRRRVGKTTLVQEVFKNKFLAQFEGLEEQSSREQLANFIEQLQITWPNHSIDKNKIVNWRSALRELAKVVKKGDVIFFDEFQWMANYRNQLVSDLKMIWDQYLLKKQVTLILCGSIASFMKDKVVHSKSLYGRCDLTIHLHPLKLQEIKKMLPHKSSEEIIETYLCLGGIPRYIEYTKLYSSLYLAMEELAFKSTGIIFEEYAKIFLSHFGRNKEYQQIIECLATHPYGILRKDIASTAKVSDGGQLTKLLDDLEAANFILSQRPFFREENSKEIRYILYDNYLSFYFAFIKPNRTYILQRRDRFFLELTNSPKYLSWLGKSFECLCLNHANEIASILNFAAVKYKFGPYFRTKNKTKEAKNGLQIDLLFDRADKVITLCEIKYTSTPIGIDVIKDVERKRQILIQEFKKTVEAVLITKSPPTIELSKRNYFSRIILATELLA
ncbi:MAG: AAA family ATPase [Oligoflexia bacterium]|nr:AAA family ATPase [Oligoflexia bacterium]